MSYAEKAERLIDLLIGSRYNPEVIPQISQDLADVINCYYIRKVSPQIMNSTYRELTGGAVNSDQWPSAGLDEAEYLLYSLKNTQAVKIDALRNSISACREFLEFSKFYFNKIGV